MVKIDKSRVQRVKLFDWIASRVITLGGIIIIGSVIAVIVLLVSVTIPLFGGPDSTVRIDAALPSEVPSDQVVRLGVDLVEIGEGAGEDALSAYAITKDGTITYFDFIGPADAEQNSAAPKDQRPSVLGQSRLSPETGSEEITIEFVDQANGSEYTLLWSDGSVSLVEAIAKPEFDGLGRRSVNYEFRTVLNLPPEDGPQAVRAVARLAEGGSSACAKLLPENRIVVLRDTVVQTLFGAGEKKTSRIVIDSQIPGDHVVTAMTMNRKGNMLFVGTDRGLLLRWQLDDIGGVSNHGRVSVPGNRTVTALNMVFGDVSLAVGDADGNVTTWSPIRGGDDQARLKLVHRLSRHDGPVRQILPSQRNKSLLSLGESGVVFLDYMTTEKHLLTMAEDRPIRMMGYSPRGNAMIGLDEQKKLIIWQIHSPHPEISWGTLFGKVWYDNHDEPKFMWQSSGTDEPKFSLVPVLNGTLKSTVYAMLFAVPIALFAAMYVSHFTTPGFKRAIKPMVEVMAAIPTVVIGFLILLWAAPLVGTWIVGVFAGMLTIPITFVLFMILWSFLRRFDWAKWVENGYEFLVLIPVVVVGVLVATALTGPVEQWLFGGDFRQWLYDSTGNRYDQLNSLVVAFGLGFAVIPIIFSISEDALSDIPYSLTAASLALGASRWQTVWRVILPSASPAIFAAIMIGFGRAVGETMIVFMATGNTPIMDWSPFNGFRTLSANIAVEISEAPRGGTLYRVLFLCAVILFLLTFALNTAAEIVRVRLRKKYGRY
jgi:phosphate transport system permease protein